MEVTAAIRSRHSVRAYKPDPVPRKVLEELLEVCIRAPSWANSQPWEFAILGGKVIEEVKKKLARALNEFLDPIRERRSYYQERPELVDEIIRKGSAMARAVASETLSQAREAMGINYFRKG